jgi:hypothetical protein
MSLSHYRNAMNDSRYSPQAGFCGIKSKKIVKDHFPVKNVLYIEEIPSLIHHTSN